VRVQYDSGVSNPGNKCYLISIIATFAACAMLVDMLQSDACGLAVANIADANTRVAVRELFKVIVQYNANVTAIVDNPNVAANRAINPAALITALGRVPPTALHNGQKQEKCPFAMVRNQKQQDMGFVLRAVMDLMCVLSCPAPAPTDADR
jgi:hypothetical protein